MHPIHDVDVLLLLATTLSSKRHAAELVEIIAAVDLIQGAIPPEAKLRESFLRLAAHGLIHEVQGGFTLTPGGLKVMADQSKKANTDERLFSIKGKLAAHLHQGDCPPILLTEEQVRAAVLAHQALRNTEGRNLFMPKPKPAEDDKRRKPKRKPFGFSARRR